MICHFCFKENAFFCLYVGEASKKIFLCKKCYESLIEEAEEI